MLQLIVDSQTSTIVYQGTNHGGQSQKPEDKKVSEEEQIVTATSNGQSTKYAELEMLQEELKGKLRANDSNIKEIVDKISSIQTQLYQ